MQLTHSSKPPRFKPLNLSSEYPVSKFCFQTSNLYRYAAQYLATTVMLRRELLVTRLGWAWYACNAVWPLLLYTTGMRWGCTS
jgi:hypothetical protein